MSILTVGSVAYDHIITPYAERKRSLGGSVVYFSLAAQHFSAVNLVAVVGEDFDQKDADIMTSHNINLDGLERKAGKTFFWKGEYLANWNDRITHETQLNVFETFSPEIPESYKDTEVVFLGNIAPELQSQVLDQMNQPKMVILDSMNLWISTAKPALLQVLKRVDHLLINDSEAKMLGGKENLMEAAKVIREMGPTTLCIKKGEHGAMLIHQDKVFIAPAFPFCNVVDPTGAGDSFAGGYVGYLASAGKTDWETLKKAVVYGSIMGSHTVEAFSVDRLVELNQRGIANRYKQFVNMTHFDSEV
ncbi:MAG: sugar kinase [Acidobacteria bacterium]|nr:MAG: sugar kinase [Acidobacteriota bacterium]